MNKIILARMPVKIDAAAADKPARLTIQAYSGGPMNVSGYGLPVVIDLDGLELPTKIPLLADHENSVRAMLGAGIPVIEKGQLIVEGTMARGTEIGKTILALHESGAELQASVGAMPTNTETIPANESRKVNGRDVNGKTSWTLVKASELVEVSLTPRGADNSTSVSIAAQKPQKGKPMEKNQQVTWPPADGAQDDTDNPIALERKRITAIHKANAKYPNIEAKQRAEILEKAINEDWDINKAELEMIRADRPKGVFGVGTGGGNYPDQAEVIAASACMSIGITAKFLESTGVSKQVLDCAMSRPHRGASLHTAIFATLAAAGAPVPNGTRVNDDILRAALHADAQISAQASMIRASGGGFSTMSLSGITENIMNKALLASYGSIESVVSEIAFETDTNDFKQFKRYRLTASGAMQPVGPTGELKNMSLQDESYANQLGTVGAIINIPRPILINDDMGALVQTPQVIGRQAGISREKAVFTALLANTGNFFHADNKNYLSGGSSALSITSLTSAEQKLLEQKDANNDPIMVFADRVLVPPALRTTAMNLFNGAEIVVGALGATNSKSIEPNINAHKGRYRPIVSPWLGTQLGLTNASDTGWYLLPNPTAGMGVVTVGYLGGQRVPIIEQGQPNFNTLGLAMRGYFDFGVALMDYRCGVFSAGA